MDKSDSSAGDSKEIGFSMPGEWALKKAFGPVLSEIGEDIKRLYATGRDRILAKGYSKIQNPNDDKKANLRVTRDVLWNGAFTDDEVCAEYFGGILASSRSDDGKDDSSIQYVDVIKSLSSKQLRLHYLAYNALNKIMVATSSGLNVGQGKELGKITVWMPLRELELIHEINIDTDFNILFRQGLISEYQTDAVSNESSVLPYVRLKATTFGVLLYASAYNRLEEWRLFSSNDFGNFQSIEPPQIFANSLSELKKLAGMPEPKPPEAKLDESQ